MLYACVRRFDVTGTVEEILGTNQGLNVYDSVSESAAHSHLYHWPK